MTTRISRRGLMLVLSSPSGAGKTAISRAILDTDEQISLSVSVTTRPRRSSETDGVDYVFVDNARFGEMVAKNEFIEHATVFDNRYGTPRAPVEEALSAGRDALFDVDWQGAQTLKAQMGNDVISVFILPPSTAELGRRLRARAEDAEDVVAARMARAADETSHWAEYDYVVVNDEFGGTVRDVRAILCAERLKRHRQHGLIDFVKSLSETP